jgi:hypothetical protein
MSRRRSWRVVASLLAGACVLAASGVSPAYAQDPAAAQVVIEPVGTEGVSGLAIMSPAASGTSIQILVSGAPAETFAVIHAGTCDAIDPLPVALLDDVSRTSQVTVTNPFAMLTDGRHVLALHAGLDLTTAVGCGAIPAVAAPSTPPVLEPTQEPPAQGGSYTGPLTGIGISWPAGWQSYEVVAVDGQDRVGLSNGFSSMLLAASLAPEADPQACVRDARQELFDRLDAGSLRDLAPLTDAQGAAISGVETGRAWLAYRYVSVAQDGEADIADHLECRDAGDLLLYILHRSSPDDYDRASEAREGLLAGLVLPDGPPASTPPPSPPPASTPTPAPTPNAACDGFATWHEATLARVDTLATLRSEETQAAGDVLVSGDPMPYRALLKRLVLDLARLRTQQEGEAAPPVAQDAQARAVVMFERYGTAARILSDYYETSTDMITLDRARDAQKAAEQSQREFEEALVAAEAVCG